MPQSLSLIFRSFKYRNFRLYFAGQGISQIGFWVQQTALSWLVYRVTGSPFYLGLVGFATQIPAFVMGPVAGVIIDRFSRYRILIVTQLLSMLQAVTLAGIVLAGDPKIWQIMVLAVFLGLINAFDVPARQTFITELVEKKDERGNAIALNSMLFNIARILGPSIAGFLIALVGEGICFLLNAISFTGVLTFFFFMKIKVLKTHATKFGFWKKFKEGFYYSFTNIPVRMLLSLVGFTSFVAMPYAILMPAFAKDILHGNASSLGLLMAASGAGALAGALVLGMREGIAGMGRFIAISVFIFGAGLISLSLCTNLYWSMLFLSFIGFGMIGQMASCNTLLQTIVGEDMRGRVMSFYTMAFMGMMPLGSLVIGTFSDAVSVPVTFFISGTLCLAGSFIFYLQIPKLRSESQ